MEGKDSAALSLGNSEIDGCVEDRQLCYNKLVYNYISVFQLIALN
jgi:hypothetical protein